MLVFAKPNLVFLAVPKTGTTAVETALRRHADMVFAHQFKHVTARRFRRRIRPFLEQEVGREVETFALMRSPLDQLRSWYRYRARPGQVAPEKSTANISFDEFIAALLLPSPPKYAQVGSQYQFLTNPRGLKLVDHLFAYEAQDRLLEFLSNRLGFEVDFDKHNVSPPRKAPLAPELESALRKARAREFALYERLWNADGYLGPKGRKRRHTSDGQSKSAQPKQAEEQVAAK